MPSRSICDRANSSISRSFESGAPRASSVSRSTSDAAPPTPSQTSSMSRLTMRGETSSSFAKARKSSRPTSSILLVDPMRMAIRRSRPPYTTVEAMSYTGANANDDQSVPRSTVRFLRCPSQFPRTAFARYLAPTPSCAWATAFLEAQYRVRPCSQRESPCPAGPSAFRSPIERQTLFLRRTSRQVLLACIQAACDDCESPPQSPARFEWPCPHLPSIIIAIAIIAQEEKKNIAIAIKTALCVCDQHRDLRNRLAADA